MPVDVSRLRPYPTHLITPSKYGYLWSVLVSRGCPHRCEFCTVPPFFRGKYRRRPVDEIVAEIKALPRECWLELHADHLTGSRKYALELFRALAPLGIHWVGESTLKMADDRELLEAAAASGCKSLLVGIETPSQAALNDSGKTFVDTKSVREKIRRFHEVGISITSSMIFGFDSHTKDIFRESVEFCREIEIDEVESVILIPFPGTPLHRRLEDEGRLLTPDWSKYDGSHAVFKPKNMTPEELEEGADWFWREIRKGSAGQPRSREPGTGKQGPRLTSAPTYTFRWRSILALGAIAAAFLFDMYWVWGLILLSWAFIDIRHGATYLLEDIPRSESPLLYWTVVLMWVVLGVWALVASPGPVTGSLFAGQLTASLAQAGASLLP